MHRLKVASLMAMVIALCSFSLIGKHQDDKDKKPKKNLGVDYQLGFFREADLRRHAIITVAPVYPEEAINAGAQGLAQVAVVRRERRICWDESLGIAAPVNL